VDYRFQLRPDEGAAVLMSTATETANIRAMQLMRASGPMIAGVIDALRLMGDKNPEVGLDLMLIMQRAEAVERNIHDAYTQLNYTSPNPIDYIGEVICEEGAVNGTIKWVVCDYDPEDNKCEVEKVLTDSIDHEWSEVISREWMPFSEVREYLAAWRYPIERSASPTRQTV
jgi:hypothetical protein